MDLNKEQIKRAIGVLGIAENCVVNYITIHPNNKVEIYYDRYDEECPDIEHHDQVDVIESISSVCRDYIVYGK